MVLRCVPSLAYHLRACNSSLLLRRLDSSGEPAIFRKEARSSVTSHETTVRDLKYRGSSSPDEEGGGASSRLQSMSLPSRLLSTFRWRLLVVVRLRRRSVLCRWCVLAGSPCSLLLFRGSSAAGQCLRHVLSGRLVDVSLSIRRQVFGVAVNLRFDDAV